MYANPAISIVCLPHLSAEQCDAVLDRLDAESWERGQIAQPRTDDAAVEQVVRSCHITRDLDQAVASRLEHDLRALNDRVYRFGVQGVSGGDPITIMRYEPGDHFVWHVDNGAAVAPFASRKISFSLQLSDPADYDGGDLEFAMYSQAYGEEVFQSYREQLRARGALIAFPSFHLHRVTPVTRGVRYAIVGWLHGAPFK